MIILERHDVGIRTIGKGESYPRRCVNTDGHPNGVIDTVAVTDGVCIVTLEGCEFFPMWAIRKLLGQAREVGVG